MNPRNLTREAIEKLNDIEPYCFETDREEQWFNIGLQYGLDVADSDPKSPWISVKKDLPCNHEELLNAKYETKEVFVLKTGGFPDVDYMLKVNGKWTWFTYKNSKFWIPIPEPPKE